MKEQNQQTQTAPELNNKQKSATISKSIYRPLTFIFISLIIFGIGISLGFIISKQKAEGGFTPLASQNVISVTPQPTTNNI
ncbi:hypothetical protein A3A76_02290 [Candidatus Woesebacteria bacterium RIFCSPLOWO2_01_FULL_39_23]|uniref:Uncharacterized protein n=1 Tax=Candidatus Woesebacteria bacterium RIFCSPHIGHO2_01_FULL_40_22 TaxID=1802499 RepID=A0A1F7YGD8_9BACT|nr:MAG: hypothetical protein A2141_03445 [Candidatus Woesebacteria bacterium RBG_16_40_11]OGM26230.1 MAG: hypothetical protein A2628_02725 [Candidatus Woesebacteria bacterium RIFCSPHIGHO2_01_FULL_40_22]OGM36487.1 MAG: hypothetical protein A3E41_00545 [Candidatus Woesebacteria bacterium RIFCSPHIGHO2_12_FULL_38_9]OGM62388.1 MAG: hypothetical protein A3A76_02290 [Candidatus Woesebacteria bacterium RIFCSPLOWO2_01_FULL_39_23]